MNSARAYSVEEKKVFLSKLELYEDERGIIVSSFTNIQMWEGAVPSVIDIKKSPFPGVSVFLVFGIPRKWRHSVRLKVK